jgi:hypothetical protein
MNKKFTIEVEMEEAWVNDFCSMLSQMEYLGNIGSSRTVGIYSDGDGNFRPKFNFNIDFEKVEPARNKNIETIQYDAG